MVIVYSGTSNKGHYSIDMILKIPLFKGQVYFPQNYDFPILSVYNVHVYSTSEKRTPP